MARSLAVFGDASLLLIPLKKSDSTRDARPGGVPGAGMGLGCQEREVAIIATTSSEQVDFRSVSG